MNSCAQDGIQFYNQGLEFMNSGRYEHAIEIFSKGAELNDISKSVNHLGRARCFFELGQYENAKKDIEISLKTEILNKEWINSGIYWLKGMIYSIEGDSQNELKAYEKAIEYSPNDNSLKITYSLVLIESNREKEAIQILNSVIIESKEDSYALNNRALGLINLGRFEEAKLDLDKSSEIDQENPFLYKNYSLYYIGIGDKEKACKNLNLALEKNMSDYGYQKDSDEILKLKSKHCEPTK